MTPENTGGTHPALEVPKELFLTQREDAATLKGELLAKRLTRAPAIAASVQMMLLTTHMPRSKKPLRSLAAHRTLLPSAQRELLKLNNNNSGILNVMAGNPAITSETVEALLERRLYATGVLNLAVNPVLTADQRLRFFTKLGQSNPDMASTMAIEVLRRNDNLDPGELAYFIDLAPESLRYLALRNPALDPVERARLAKEGSSREKETVAKNPALSEDDQLALLSDDRSDFYEDILRYSWKLPPKVRGILLAMGPRVASSVIIRRAPEMSTEEIDDVIFKRLNVSGSTIVSDTLIRWGKNISAEALSYAFGGGAGAPAQEAAAGHSSLPPELLKEAAFAPRGSALLKGAVSSPNLYVDASYPLQTIIQVAMRQYPSVGSSLEARGRAERNRRAAKKVLKSLTAQVRTDFWLMFARTWEGSGQEFVEYAQMLDN